MVANVQLGPLDDANIQKQLAMNCWEFKQCGRDGNGSKAHEFGICPAYSLGAGEACWLVAGTMCGGEVQGTYAQELGSCTLCDFFQQFDFRHRYAMWRRFQEGPVRGFGADRE